ncbi:MAG: IS1 family transposase, partial [Geminicoccaceae bacterium]|nr:IS1 family transposase [Geminicoccaceae bacterium]
MTQQHVHTLTATCPGCNGSDTVKDGHVRGRPRRRCKACGRRYQRTSPRGHPKGVKHQALKPYALGLSLNRTGQVILSSPHRVV